jgi:carbon monoxide dehydrogenase subunit G
MIETEQKIAIAANIDGIWDYVKDMRRWADLMPGMREFEVINDDDSRWVLKVGVGGLVRTVKVLVHVDEWAGPGGATFSYKLEGDPVSGGGTYTAVAVSPGLTDITLNVRVEGGGPLAPMWEAMGRPLLPQLVGGFANQLKTDIENALGVAPADRAATARPSLIARIGAWLRRLWRRLAG